MTTIIIVFASQVVVGVVSYGMGRKDGYLARIREEARDQLEAMKGEPKS